jgi:hypothetical protein
VSDIANQLTRICALTGDEGEDQHGVIEFYRALRSIYGITIIGQDHTYLPLLLRVPAVVAVMSTFLLTWAKRRGRR